MSTTPDNPPEFRESKIWFSSHKGLGIEIKNWDLGEKPKWNYYIYIYEHAFPTQFEELWLPDEVREWTPGGTKYVYHNESSLWTSDVDWHCGVTYYCKHGQAEGFRSVCFGCDYSHYWDEGKSYSLEYVKQEAIRTAEQIAEGLAEREKGANK